MYHFLTSEIRKLSPFKCDIKTRDQIFLPPPAHAAASKGKLSLLSRVFVLDKVTDFLLLLGKLVVVGAVGVLSFYFFSGEWRRVKQRDVA